MTAPSPNFNQRSTKAKNIEGNHEELGGRNNENLETEKPKA